MARSVILNLIGNDRASGAFRSVRVELDNASQSSSRLSKAFSGLSKAGKVGGLATAAAGALALTKAALPATAAIAALPAAMAATKVATATLKVGLTGVGDAMSAVAKGDAKALDKALKELSPNAAAFVKQTIALKSSWDGVQRSVQDRLFQGLAGDLKPLAGNLLPTVRKGMVSVAGALNGVGREAIRTAQTPWFRGQVARVFGNTAAVTRTLQGAVRPLLESVLRLVNAGFPLVQRMAGWAAGGVKAAGAFLASERGARALTGVVQAAGDRLAQLGRIGRNVALALGSIVSASGAFNVTGGDVLRTLEQMTARFAAWTRSAAGQQQVTQTFQLFGQAAQQIVQVLPLLLSPLVAVAKVLVSLPAPLRGVVSQMIAWSVVIGVVGNRLKVLTGITIAWTVATRAATAAQAAWRAVMSASAVGGFAAGLRNAELAFAATATQAQILGAALRSQILLWRQQAAAAGVSTARIIAQAAATKVAAAATRVWAAATWLFNAAVRANPIGIIITAITLLVVAIVIAYKKSEAFRSVVQAAWAGIKAAALTAWNGVIRPVFAALVAAVRVVGAGVLWLWRTVIVPAWNGIRAGIAAAWAFIRPVFTVIATVVRTVLGIAFIVLKNTLKIVWIAIQIYIKVAWAVIKSVFNAIKVVVTRILGPIFRWLWRNVIMPVWRGIRTAISLAWAGIRVIWAGIKIYILNVLAPVFRWLWRNVITPVWNGIKTAISAVWNHGIKPVFNAVKAAVGTVAGAFKTAVGAIKSHWDKIKAIAKAPVNFVIGVYNRGIVDLVNKVAGFAGIKTRLGKIPTLARGGTLADPAPIAPMRTNGAMAIVGEGRKAWPEYVIPTDPRFRGRARGLWAAAGADLYRGGGRWLHGSDAMGGEGIAFAGGGTLQTLAGGGIIGGFLKGLKDFAFGNVEKVFKATLGKLIGVVPGSGVFRDVIAAIPNWLKNTLFAWFRSKVGLGGGIGGPGVRRALAWAKAQAGKPYIWGGVGPGGYDCSGFMSAITNVLKGRNPFSRLFTTFSFTGASRGPQGFVRNANSGFRVGVTNAGVGHMAGTLGGVNVESSGSRGVHYGPGARGADDGLFGMRYGLKFDEGGLLPPGWSTVYNGLGRPEPVFPTLKAAEQATGGRGGALVETININHVPGYSTPQDLMRGLRQAELSARHHRRK